MSRNEHDANQSLATMGSIGKLMQAARIYTQRRQAHFRGQCYGFADVLLAGHALQPEQETQARKLLAGAGLA